jgi:hypothetical protein
MISHVVTGDSLGLPFDRNQPTCTFNTQSFIEQSLEDSVLVAGCPSIRTKALSSAKILGGAQAPLFLPAWLRTRAI